MIRSTTSLDDARDCVWDVIVVGAGPAGSVAALELARRGFKVLLADRSEFPRHKLCGACLNGDAIAGLRELNLAEAVKQLHGEPLHQFSLRAGGRPLSLTLPVGIAVSRSRLDAMLVESAINAGAEFLSGVRLELEPEQPGDDVRRLSTTDRNDSRPVVARVIVMATGLPNDRGTSDAGLTVVPARNSRIGAGTTTTTFPAEYVPGTIFMAVGRSGYVGLTRTNGDALNIAAALDHKAVRETNPRSVCEGILKEAGFAVSPEMFCGDWRGTVGLTRHRQTPAATRVLVVGDAAGYVEPFTGEGMAWAIRGAQAVVPFVERAVVDWNASIIQDWTRSLRQKVTRRQRRCRVLARVLKYPTMVRTLVRIVSAMPSLGEAVIRQLNTEHCDELLNPRTRHSGAA